MFNGYIWNGKIYILTSFTNETVIVYVPMLFIKETDINQRWTDYTGRHTYNPFTPNLYAIITVSTVIDRSNFDRWLISLDNSAIVAECALFYGGYYLTYLLHMYLL